MVETADKSEGDGSWVARRNGLDPPHTYESVTEAGGGVPGVGESLMVPGELNTSGESALTTITSDGSMSPWGVTRDSDTGK